MSLEPPGPIIQRWARDRWIRYAVLSALISQGKPGYQFQVEGGPYPSTYTSIYQYCRGYCYSLSPAVRREETDKELDRLHQMELLLKETSGRYVRFALA